MSDWLKLENVTLRSGRKSSFKIECDNLTDTEISAMCNLLASILPPFGSVSGVPTGGLRVEEHMKKFVTSGPLLVVDDVWTTGESIYRFTDKLPYDDILEVRKAYVAVLFARGPIPVDVFALFELHRGLWLK